MKLYFLRHAIAVERGTIGFEQDGKRPLTSEGRKKMEKIADGVNALKLSFDAILSSPYARARETAEIIVQSCAMKDKQIIFTQNLLPEASFKNIISQINALDQRNKNILLVGHEPHLSGLISFLLTQEQRLPMTLKKGGICHLTAGGVLKPGGGCLQWLLSPSQLRRIK